MIEVVALRGLIAGVDRKRDRPSRPERLSDHTGCLGENAVLNVRKVQEAEGTKCVDWRLELEPFAPASTAFDAVGI